MSDRGTQYTIRGVKPEVDLALRMVAEARHMSLNAFLVEELGRIAVRSVEAGRHHDLDFAIGSMSDGAEVDNALRAFGQIDPELWK